VRREGIEQSFRFDSLPVGSGDLVVRGRIVSELPASTVGPTDGELRFEFPGVGGVSYGAVLGLDARGRWTRGTLAVQGDGLEIALPEAFVAEASFPLLLDPLVGPIVVLPSGFDDADPDVAYGVNRLGASESYLVVWERRFSAADVDIRGQRLNTDATLLGGLLSIETTAEVALNPAVCYSRATGGCLPVLDRYLVVWQEGPSSAGPWDIACKSVNLTTGALSAKIDLAAGAPDETDPDAGELACDTVLVVWDEDGFGIRGRMVQPSDPVGFPPGALGGIFDFSAGGLDDSLPKVSKARSGYGFTVVALVVWQRFFAGAPGDHDLRARAFGYVYTLGNTFLSNGVPVLTTIGPDEEDPDCDLRNLGNGTFSGIVVYEREAALGSLDNDIRCKSVTLSLTPLVSPTALNLTVGVLETVLEGDAGDDEVNPAVAFVKPKYLVAWADEVAGFNYDLVMLAVDPASCAVCETETTVDASSERADRPEIATRILSGSDEALIAWQSTEQLSVTTFDSDIRVRRASALGAGGAVAPLGGGCGGGGACGTSGPVALGNPTFAFTLGGAHPAATSGILALSPLAGNVVCGACTLVPTLNFFTVFAAVAGGGASVPFPIPCIASLNGATLYGQWIVFPVPTSPCAPNPNFALSDAISVTAAP
jgi:hypothetical protein